MKCNISERVAKRLGINRLLGEKHFDSEIVVPFPDSLQHITFELLKTSTVILMLLLQLTSK